LQRIPLVAIAFFFVTVAPPAQAGMPSFEVSDVARMRLEDISFFGFLLLVAALGIRLLWNFLARDFPKLPRLTYLRALSLTGLLSLLMLLILVMIAGARELLTPGAWYRQASHYRPSDTGNKTMRQQSLDSLRAALMQYAREHEGRFPPHDYVPEIPAKLWESPDNNGTRYIYVGGLTLSQTNAVLACEPPNFGDERAVLFVSGKIEGVKTRDLHKLFGVQDPE
jgi:hypothetical protein